MSGADVRLVRLSELDLSDRRFQLRQIGDLTILRRRIAVQRQVDLVDVLELDPRSLPSLLVIDGFPVCDVLVELGIPTVRVRVLAGLTLEQARRHAVTKEVGRLFRTLQVQLRTACAAHLRRRPFLRDRIEPDDLAAALWLKALKSLFPPGCEPRTDEEVRAHLGRMVVDVLLDVAKQSLRLKRTALREVRGSEADEALREASHDRDPAHDAIRQEQVALIEAALTKIAPGDRELIVLARLEGIPLRQLSQLKGLGLDAVKSRFRRALERLRRVLLCQLAAQPAKD